MQEILNDIGSVYLVFSLAFVINNVVCVFLFIRSKKFIANSIITKAKILGSSNLESGGYYVVEYNDRLGRKLTERVHCALATLKIGDEIEIRYDKDNPSKARINTKFHIFVVSIATFVFNFALVAMIMYFENSGVPF